jgi:dolichol-phosphate mannosyltransferase
MNRSTQASQASPVAVSIVIHSVVDASTLDRVLRAAKGTLGALARSYEILVIGANAATALSGEGAEDSDANRQLRFVSEEGNGGFAGALQSAAAYARGHLVAVTDGSLDLDSLAYLVPYAEQHPIVWGYRPQRHGSFLYRCLSMGYSALVRLLLGAPVRDCSGGTRLAVFQRSILPQILPESRDPHAAAEVLARAGQCGIPVVEAAVQEGLVGCGLSLGTTHNSLATTHYSWRRVGQVLAGTLRYWWSSVRFGGPVPAPPSKVSWLAGLLLAVLASLILFTKLGQPLLDPDEGRQAEIPREMLAHHDLMLPRMLGEPYYEKPPLHYWLTAAAYKAFGMFAWSARLVPATSAWLAVIVTFVWGRRVLGARPAFLGGLVLCLTPGFVVLGRTLVLDSLLGFCVVASWYTAYLAVNRPHLRWRWWLTSSCLCGLGILAKGPAAMALLGVPVMAFQFLNLHAARCRWTAWAAYVGLALALAAPWYVVMALADPDFLYQCVWRANVVRFLSPFDHEQPWWFYFPILFVATLPWSFLWPALIYFLGGHHPRLAQFRSPALGFSLLMVVWCLTFYSLSGCKSPPYLAPALPPLALLLGACMDAIVFQLGGPADSYLAFTRYHLPRRLTYFTLAIAAGCYVITSLLGWQAWGWALAKAGLALAFLAGWWLWGRRTRPTVAWGVCAAVMLAFITVTLREATAGYASRHSPAPIAHVYRKLPDSSERPLISYGRQWNSASFYLSRDVVCCFDEQHQAELFSFLCSHPKSLVLVESGAPLQEFLNFLPAFFTAEVHTPKKEGQAALVVIRPNVQLFLAHRDEAGGAPAQK